MSEDGVSSDIKIRIRGLTKSFGRKTVLNQLDLDVPKGQSMVVIGGSGTGKSVLIKNLIGIMMPDSGSILIDGEETVGLTGADRDRVQAKFGMLFQGAALFDSLPVWENVAFGLIEGKGVRRSQAREIAIEKLALVGLGARLADRAPSDLSAGMQKRVGLARAIATDPEILFFDEPTTGLDPIMGDVINELIVHCVDELGATAITITHDMTSARRISDRVAMIYGGKIIWDGPINEIDSADEPVVDQFVHGRLEGPIRLQAHLD